MADGPTITIGTAEVKVQANLDTLDRGFDRAQEAARKFEAAMQRPTSLVSRHFNKMSADAAAAARQAARAAEETARAQARAQAAYDRATAAMNRQENSLASLVRRYTSWAAIATMVRSIAQESIRTNEGAAAAVDRLNQSYSRLSENAAPAITIATDLMNAFVDSINLAIERHTKLWERLQFKGIPKGGGGGWGGSPEEQLGMRLDKKTGNWTPGAQGFPAAGMTDLTADAKELADALEVLEKFGVESVDSVIERQKEVFAEEKKAAEERMRALVAENDRLFELYQERKELSEDWRKHQEKVTQEFDEGVRDSLRTMAEAGIKLDSEREAKLNRELEDALEYLEKLGEESAEASRDRVDQTIEDQKRAFDEIADYWENVNREMSETGRDFWLEFLETGEFNFKSLARSMRQIWGSVLYDLAKQWASAKLGGGGGGGGFGLGGLFGGAGSSATFDPSTGNWTPGAGGFGGGGMNWGMGAGFGLSMAGSMVNAGVGPGGNTRVGSALSGAGTGAMMGTMILPGIGTVVGAAIGAIAGLISGQDKVSDNRSVATFMPGMMDFGVKSQSAHEVSEATLGGVQQAAEAIRQEILALKEAGIEITSQLSNIWLGERDESSFQLAGGQRISTGTIGDAADLASDVLGELLKTAVSDDPEIMAILKAGGSTQAVMTALNALKMARAFTDEIELALLQIQEPMKAAIMLWQKEAQARLDMAASLGVEISKVQELNQALFNQMTQSVNAGAISAVQGLISQLQFGGLSSASPGEKYAAGLAEFEKARQAALGGGAKEIEAFASIASSFLPQAQDYLGISRELGGLQSTTLNTLQTLLTGLTAPQTMPDLKVPMEAGFSMTVGAVETLTEEVKGLRADNQNLALQIAAMARGVPV